MYMRSDCNEEIRVYDFILFILYIIILVVASLKEYEIYYIIVIGYQISKRYFPGRNSVVRVYYRIGTYII